MGVFGRIPKITRDRPAAGRVKNPGARPPVWPLPSQPSQHPAGAGAAGTPVNTAGSAGRKPSPKAGSAGPASGSLSGQPETEEVEVPAGTAVVAQRRPAVARVAEPAAATQHPPGRLRRLSWTQWV